MWQKPLIIILVFYLFALLQNSFFSHFNFFGAVPNLVFTFFFLLLFFDKRTGWSAEIIFYALAGGFFADIFSYSYIGPSIIIFFLIVFLQKKIRSLLKNTRDPYPIGYFLPLFLIFLAGYDLLMGMMPGVTAALSVIYNLVVATGLFYLYKWQKFTK